MKIIVDVKPSRIESAIVYAPFDKAKEVLESNGYRIISLEENAKLRMQQGKEHYVSKNSNWTREDFIYLPDSAIAITKNSPIMLNSKEATQAHRNGNEFYLIDEQAGKALENSVKVPRGTKPIPTNDFKNNEITAFVFGDVAEDYGLFLKEAGIEEMPLYLASPENKPFARKMWFRCLGDRFGLAGNNRNLYYDDWLRGIKEIGDKK